MPIASADSEHAARQQRFMDLLDPVHDRLARFAHAMTRNRDEARDLVCETLLVAFEHFDQLRDPSAFASYLFTIARRSYRDQQRRGTLFTEFDEQRAERIRDDRMSPETAADIRLLHDALAELPESQREAVILFELSDLSLEDIRNIQGGTLSGVKARVTRGRKKLMEKLSG